MYWYWSNPSAWRMELLLTISRYHRIVLSSLIPISLFKHKDPHSLEKRPNGPGSRSLSMGFSFLFRCIYAVNLVIKRCISEYAE